MRKRVIDSFSGYEQHPDFCPDLIGEVVEEKPTKEQIEAAKDVRTTSAGVLTVEAVARAWASIDGMLEAFDRGQSGNDDTGTYEGYMADAEELLRLVRHFASVNESGSKQLRQGRVKVKPLEWTEFTFAGLPSFWNAEAASFGVYYRIERDRDCFWMSLGEEWSLHDTPEEAKAAAQADYERRILAALEPASASRGRRASGG